MLRWILPPGAEKTRYLSGINQLMLSWCLIASRLAKPAGDFSSNFSIPVAPQMMIPP